MFTTRFSVKKFYVLPTHCIYVLRMDLRTNSDYFPVQHYNRDGVCLLCGTRCVCKCSSGQLCDGAFGRSCDRPIRPFSVVLMGPRGNAELVPKMHVTQHASHAVLLKIINLKNFGKTQPSRGDTNFVILLPSKHKIQPKFSVSFLCSMLSIVHFPSSCHLHFPKFLHCYWPTLTRRMSESCLGNFRVVKFSNPPPPPTAFHFFYLSHLCHGSGALSLASHRRNSNLILG
jgi:hypothetical protein